MKIALVAWDFDESLPGALVRLGLECAAYTRWFEGRPIVEDGPGWVLRRCPHQLGGGSAAEARAFGESIVKRAVEESAESPDVVHALDPPARWALAGFKRWWPRCNAVGQLVDADLHDDDSARASFACVDRWICAEPWVAERWRATYPGDWRPIHVVDAGSGAAFKQADRDLRFEPFGPLILIWASADAEIDATTVVEAIALARRTVDGVRAVVLGSGVLAESLRRRLDQRAWLATSPRRVADPTLERWRAWLAAAAVVGVGARSLPNDPMARSAWLAGRPAVSLAGMEPTPLARAIVEALHMPDRTAAAVRAGAAFALTRREPASIALAWLGVYLESITSPRAGCAANPETPWPLGARRTRLDLVAVDSRHVYASWSVRAADWTNVLDSLGLDATRAKLAIRFEDIEPSPLPGEDGRVCWEVGVGLVDEQRTIRLEVPCRALVARLGIRPARGEFRTLAYSRVCQVPCDELAPTRPTRRARVLTRRAVG